LFAREGIMIFATKEYIDAVWFIPPLTMSVLFSFITGIIGNILFYYEKTWQMSAITITCAIINLVTNFFGIKYFGDIAAGYTTLGCSFIQLLLYYFVVRRYEKNLNKIVDLRWFFAIMIVYVGFMVYSMVFQNIFWARAGLLFAVLLAVVILHKKIIELIKSMLQKEKTEDNTSQETVSEEANV